VACELCGALSHRLQIEVLNTYLFLTAKPVIYLINLSAKDYGRKKNKWLPHAYLCVSC
jgi:ribosome-binding ATPase YchF (GTP1/OBG family)